jgi:RNA polymerase sigma-70 factor (ECF subfamily)
MPNTDLADLLSASRRRFVDSVAGVRPRLHRYCSRMTGSALDGEDMVQEVLAQAYYKLSMARDDLPLEPWLFKIAHNRCIDFLRRRKVGVVEIGDLPDVGAIADDDVEQRQEVGRALVALVTELPPKERACVLLKDVFDYSLADIADIVDSTVGGVKSALHRARAKLREVDGDAPATRPDDDRLEPVVREYIDRFNRRDWDAVRELVRADARLELVGEANVELARARYFENYEALSPPWRMTTGHVDGEPVAVCWRQVDGEWVAQSAIRFEVVGDEISAVRDYVHIDYVLEGAEIGGD